MNRVQLQAFLEELDAIDKTANVGLLRGAGRMIGSRAMGVGRWAGNQPKQFMEAGKRMLSPIKSTKAGWRNMSPRAQTQHIRNSMTPDLAKKEVSKYIGNAGTHLTKGTKSKHRLGRAAEELSQRGWTGKGNLTKYMPVGGKGMTAGFAGMSVPGIIDAAKKDPTRTGEGGVGELGLGEALGTGAFIAGTGGLGMLPATAMYFGAHGLGSKAGRIIDRLRGGANLDTAANAPSPTKAREMLQNLEGQSPQEQGETIKTLRKYYGNGS